MAGVCKDLVRANKHIKVKAREERKEAERDIKDLVGTVVRWVTSQRSAGLCKGWDGRKSRRKEKERRIVRQWTLPT